MIRLTVHPDNPQERLVAQAADIVKHANGVCIYPTDTVYGMGVCAANPKAIDRIGRILAKDKKRLFSFICSDFSQMSTYCKINNAHYKLMKRYLPGPYTFILPATNYVPKKVCPKRKTVGVRMPDSPVVQMLVTLLDEPLANTSISISGAMRGDPDLFSHEVFNEVDVFLDVGILDSPVGSTIIDLTADPPELVRRGKGEWHG